MRVRDPRIRVIIDLDMPYAIIIIDINKNAIAFAIFDIGFAIADGIYRRDRPRVGRAHRPAPRARRPRGARTTINRMRRMPLAPARGRAALPSPSRGAAPCAGPRAPAGRFRRSFGGCHCHIVRCVQRGRLSEPV